LRCAACHPASDERWSAPPAPDLETVGSRLREDAIWRMIRSPQHSKKGTLMPGLFTGAEGDDEDVEALTVFLASLQRSTPVTAPLGDAGRGRELYHEVGCVACHEPATDYRPVAPPPGLPVEKPGLASVPIALASAYQPNELAMFLRQPLAHRPSARMPAQLQSIQEAADIASYLQLDEPFEPAAERKVLAVPPQTVERGRKVFRERRCDQCHALGDEAPLPSTAELGAEARTCGHPRRVGSASRALGHATCQPQLLCLPRPGW
jgi:cytochrome c2